MSQKPARNLDWQLLRGSGSIAAGFPRPGQTDRSISELRSVKFNLMKAPSKPPAPRGVTGRRRRDRRCRDFFWPGDWASGAILCKSLGRGFPCFSSGLPSLGKVRNDSIHEDSPESQDDELFPFNSWGHLGHLFKYEAS